MSRVASTSVLSDLQWKLYDASLSEITTTDILYSQESNLG